MKKLLLILSLFLISCTCEDGTITTLQNSGYTNIEITGWKPLSCSDGDTFSTGFTATNPIGKRVSGVVCCGWLKNCTVRY